MAQSARTVSKDEFDRAVEALQTEIAYQDSLPRRTEDEAVDVPGFCTLMRRYLRKVEDDWSDNPGPVKAAEEGLRKLSAIALRGMVYTRIWKRGE
jgi:hypothetical protein